MATKNKSLTPTQFAALSTSDYVEGHLEPGARILDVGAGHGYIAANLAKAGFQVTALEKGEKGLATLKKLKVKGLTVMDGDFNEQTAESLHGRFDAILFSRVLHHLEPLRGTLKLTEGLLKKEGVVIVEDFSYERVDERTCAWLFPLAKMLHDSTVKEGAAAAQHLYRHPWIHEMGVAEAESPEAYVHQSLAVWRRHHEEKHHIAPFEHIKSVMQDSFTFELESRVPYLFRYLCDLLPDTAEGGMTAREMAYWEAALAETGAIAAVGVRLVARVI